MHYDAVLIAGPTASGKSAAALALAEDIGGIIINADSMQVYAEAPILTAQPDAEAQARAPHLLYGHVPARQAYSTGRYAIDAARALTEARAQGKVAIFTGGTGLYFTALTEGLAEIPPVPPAIRAETRALLADVGVAELHARLKANDPKTASLLLPTDPQRVARAFEVFAATGRPLADWQQQKGVPVLQGLKVARFVIDLPRDQLRERIATRFAAMLEQGAVAEALALADLDGALPAARLLGLRPLIALGHGEISRVEAEEQAVTATRQFAKRQSTWFRNQMDDYVRFTPNQGNIIALLRDFTV